MFKLLEQFNKNQKEIKEGKGKESEEIKHSITLCDEIQILVTATIKLLTLIDCVECYFNSIELTTIEAS